MMINCPNCNLLQPKDQYCAQCGINMETWKAPQPPLWKKIVSNWVFQLSLLFIAIFAIVLMDSLGSKQETSSLRAAPPVRESIPRAQLEERQQQAKENFRSQPTATNANAPQSAVVAASDKKQIDDDATDKRPVLPFKKIASLRIAAMSRPSIEQINELGQKLEDNAFIVPQKIFTQFLGQERSSRKSMGGTQENFQFNKPQLLFVGEEDLETGLQLGFFAQLTVADYDPQNPLRYELIVWHQLQLSGEPGERNRIDVSLPAESYLVIIDPSAHDLSFTPEERTLFESSNRLSPLNSPRFQEEQSDIVLVLEIK